MLSSAIFLSQQLIRIRLAIPTLVLLAALAGNAQEAPPDPCATPQVEPHGLSFPAGGGSQTVVVTAPEGCPRYLVSDSPWLQVAADPSGGGRFLVTAEPNTGKDRWVTLYSHGTAISVHQLPYSDCTLSFSQPGARPGMAGGLVTVLFQLHGSGCMWNAASSQPWAAVVSGEFGHGNLGTVQLLVEPFSGPDIRIASLIVNGDEIQIHQLGFDPALPAEVRAIGSAATFNSFQLAGGGLASVFGNRLATEVASASEIPLPTELGGIRLMIKLPSGQEVAAPLLYVSPRQINLQIPEGVAGQIDIRIEAPGRGSNSYSNTVHPHYPAFFYVADGYTILTAAGYAHLVLPDGSERITPLIDCSKPYGCFLEPIDRGPEGSELYVVLFGTGFPSDAALDEYEGPADDPRVRVTYAGRHKDFVGLQQVNIHVPREVEIPWRLNFDVQVRGIRSSWLPVYFQPLSPQ